MQKQSLAGTTEETMHCRQLLGLLLSPDSDIPDDIVFETHDNADLMVCR